MSRPQRSTKRPARFDDEEIPTSESEHGEQQQEPKAKSTTRKRSGKQNKAASQQPLASDSVEGMADVAGPSSTSRSRSQSGKARQKKAGKARQKKAGKARPKKAGKANAFSGEEVAALRQNAEERKEHIEGLVDGLSEDQCKQLLKRTAAEQPAMVLDIMQLYEGEREEEPAPPAQPRTRPHWCVCGHCRLMQFAIEDVCCRQQPDNCLSNTPEMQALCLDRHVLELSMLYRADVLAITNLRQPDVRLKNASMRHAGYRQHTLWQHGRLGEGVRRVIPSCCVWKIRDTFPDPSGQYVPFRPGNN